MFDGGYVGVGCVFPLGCGAGGLLEVGLVGVYVDQGWCTSSSYASSSLAGALPSMPMSFSMLSFLLTAVTSSLSLMASTSLSCIRF